MAQYLSDVRTSYISTINEKLTNCPAPLFAIKCIGVLIDRTLFPGKTNLQPREIKISAAFDGKHSTKFVRVRLPVVSDR